MTKVIKKKQENNITLLKRFSRQIRQSGRLLRFKQSQFRKRAESNFKKKKEALKREKKVQRMNKLYKLGKIDQPTRKTHS